MSTSATATATAPGSQTVVRLILPPDLGENETDDLVRAFTAALGQEHAHDVEKAFGPVQTQRRRELKLTHAVHAARADVAFDQLQADFTLDMETVFLGFDTNVQRNAMIQRGDSKADRKNSAFMLREDLKRAKLTAQRRIRQTYEQAFYLGKLAAGNTDLPDRAELRLLERLRRNEFAYAENFMHDIRTGAGVMDYQVRADLYGNALNEARWFGFLYASLRPDRYLRWTISLDPKADHCEDCTALAKGGRWRNGVYSAQELANMRVVPGSGALRCTTRCHCELKEVARPATAPLTRRALQAEGKRGTNIITDRRGRWHSKAPKPAIRHRYEKRARKHQSKRQYRRRTGI